MLFSVFVRSKVAFNESVRTTYHTPIIQLLHCSELAVNWKNSEDVKIVDMKCYLMLLNARFIAFTISEILRENQEREE